MGNEVKAKVDFMEQARSLGYVVVECPRCKMLYAVPKSFPRNARTPCCKLRARQITSDEYPQTRVSKEPKSKIWVKEDALKKVQDVLRSEGFVIQMCEDCVFAKRNRENGLPLRLFVSVHEKESPMARPYAEAKITMVFHVTKFQQRLSNLMRWWFYPKRKPVGELNINVLTSFGWHAFLNEDTREECLMAAVNELGETHVANVLLWLKNAWPMNPIMPEEYSFNVSQDYNWFRSNFGENAYYFRLKSELLYKLQHECQKLVRERRIKLFEDKEAIDRFFLVTY
jgi:phage FluMu protein Com